MSPSAERLTVGLFAASVLALAPGLLVWCWWNRRRRPTALLPRWRGPS